MKPRIAIVQPKLEVVTETFLRAQADRLPASVTVVHIGDNGNPTIGTEPVLSQETVPRISRRIWQRLCQSDDSSEGREITAGFVRAFRDCGAQAVLAQYGPMGVMASRACKKLGLPLIVQFHGFDASVHEVLQEHQQDYRDLFSQAAAVVAVSGPMHDRLIGLGSEPTRTHLICYGVDTSTIQPGNVLESSPTFVAVGRFTDKKGPHLTLMAFARAFATDPRLRLRMIGDGKLLGVCRDITKVMEIEQAVEFLGVQSSSEIRSELSNARALVQHSMEAANGDCEGTPLAIIEAGAAGLPVIATRHAGIPHAVIDGQTGLLVDEGDVNAMADHMIKLGRDKKLAAAFGAAARTRIESEFEVNKQVQQLWSLIDRCRTGNSQRNP